MAYSTIIKPNTNFTPTIYSGTSASHAVSVGFQPDLVWLKPRSVVDSHRLMNSVSGAGFYLMSNATNDESASGTRFTSFDTDGFTLGDADEGWNQSGQTYASWNFKAGGTASSNTDGTITSSVSANTTSGFSVVTWTGTGATATVGHGLGTTPKLFIVKERSEARNWPVITTAKDGSWDYLYLNLTDAIDNSPQSANSSVFNFTSSNEFNASGQTYIAYAFAEKKGFSKFGSYVGNPSVDGTFLYLGFKPAFLVVKGSTTAESWILFDNARSPSNAVDKRLLANAGNVETSDLVVDFLSNGVKFRSDQNAIDHANTYIYMAFAEAPLVGSNNVPANAR